MSKIFTKLFTQLTLRPFDKPLGKSACKIYFTSVKFFVRLALILNLALPACGGKKPDAAQQIRAFMAEWERAVDSQNAIVLDSLFTQPRNSPPIDAQKFLDELYSSPEVKSVDLRGRQFSIGEVQATVSGLLVRSGIPDSMAHLSLVLLKTKKGWKLAAYKWETASPAKPESTGSAIPL